MDFSMFVSALAGAKETAGLLINERDRQKAAAIQVDLTEKITQAQLQLLEVISATTQQAEALRVARERIGELEADQREKHRYRLVEASPGSGVFAYRLRPAAELGERTDEPVHFVCQPCFDAGRKAVLRLSPNGGLLLCPVSERHTLHI